MTGIVTFTPNPALDISTAVERVMPTHKMRCVAPRHDPGGGGINVARVIRRLGGEVTAIYPRGGLTGQLFDRLVDGENIARRTSDISGETRQDFAVHEDASGLQFRFVLPGPVLAEHEWRAPRHACDVHRPRRFRGGERQPAAGSAARFLWAGEPDRHIRRRITRPAPRNRISVHDRAPAAASRPAR